MISHKGSGITIPHYCEYPSGHASGSDYFNAYIVLISRRFLRARSFNVQKAYEQFERSSNWRQTHKVDSTYNSFPISEFESSKQFYPRWNGRRDHLGRPVYIYRLASLVHHSKELMSVPEERRYQRIISLTEYLVRFVLPLCSDLTEDKSVDCVTTIIDLEGISVTSLWTLKSHLQQSISLTSGNYPETINTICVVNAPSFFPTIWGWVKNMFDEGTKNKVHLTGSGPDQGKELMEVVPAANLPKMYGGEMEWTYEDEPMLDDEIKAKIGASAIQGPVVWEGGKMVLLGEGERPEAAKPRQESAQNGASPQSAQNGSVQNGTTSTPSNGISDLDPNATPAIPTAPGPPAQPVSTA